MAMRAARPILRWAVSACVCALIAATSSARQGNVSLSFPATRAALLLPMISEKIGMKLEAAGDVRDQVLLIDVREAPVEQLLERIAQVAQADWAELDGKRVLSRSNAARLKLAAGDTDRYAAALAVGLAKLPESDQPFDQRAVNAVVERFRVYNEFKPMSDAERVTANKLLSGLLGALPAARLCVALARDLGPRTIALLDAGETVFAFEPTKMQRPFGPSGKRLVDRFLQEQARWADAVAALPESALTRESGAVLDPRQLANRVTRDCRFLLKVRRFAGEYKRADVTLLVASRSGGTLALETVSIDPSSALEEPDASLAPLLTDVTTIRFSPAVEELIYALEAILGPKNAASPVEIPAGLTDDILDPEHKDPLARCWFDGFRSIAQKHGLNLVAWVPDRVSWSNYQAFGRNSLSGVRFTVGNAVKHAAQTESIRIDDGWLVSRPAFPSVTLATQTDRAMLGRVVRLLHRNAFPSLQELGKAFGNARNVSYHIQDGLLLAQPRRPSIAYDIPAHAPLLRLLSSLSSSQWAVLERGGGIPFTSIASEHREDVIQGFFHMTGGARLIPNGSPQGEGLTNEPTEVYPNGLPADTVLRIDISPGNYLAGIESRSDPPSERAMYALASIGAAIARGKDQKNNFDPLRHPLYVPMVNRTYRLTVVPPKPLVWSEMLSLWLTDGPPTTLDRLPPSYEEIVRKFSGG